MDGVIYVKSPTTGNACGVRCDADAYGANRETSQNAWTWAPI